MKHASLAALLLAFACSRGEGGEEGADARRIDARTGTPDAPTSGADAPAQIDASGGGPDAPAGMLVEIQEIRDRTIALDTVVTVEQVFVTGIGTSTSGHVTLYVQEPQGDTAGSHVYPQYAGMAIFINVAKVPAVTLPAVGDCIDVTGTVDVAFSLTELVDTTITDATACGTPPAPLAVGASPSFVDLATDTDPATTGDQAGAMAEIYESVLVQLNDVEVTANEDMYGEVPLAATGTTTPTLDMDDFLFEHGATMGTSYTSVVGVYTQFTNYKVQPRSTADLTP